MTKPTNDDTPHLVWVKVKDAAKLLYQNNAKLHDIGGVCQSIAKYGFQEIPKFDKNLTNVSGEQGAIVAGNGRIEALALMEKDSRFVVPRGLHIDKDGDWVMPLVHGVDAESEAMAQAYAIDSNNLTMSGGDLTAVDMSRAWDQKKYLAILAEVASKGQEPVTVDRDTLGRLQKILIPEPSNQNDDVEGKLNRAKELQKKWQVKLGDLWEMGVHRLVCGDCTDKGVYTTLLNGEKMQLIITSPPYAVGKEYEANVSFIEHLKLLGNFADRCLENVVPGGFIFINFGEIAAQSHAKELTGSNRQCLYPISKDYWQIFHVERGCDLYAQRIWYKPFNRLQQPFWTYHTSIPHYQEWEHIWTWRLPGGDEDRVFDWDVSVHAVWDTRDESTEDKPLTRHVAAFPVCLPERALKAHSDMDYLVCDPFAGSGTTGVACQRLNRISRMIEINPMYCAVILERFAELGIEPRTINR